jgi:tetratricopeptide (TPR) repeat protein
MVSCEPGTSTPRIPRDTNCVPVSFLLAALGITPRDTKRPIVVNTSCVPVSFPGRAWLFMGAFEKAIDDCSRAIQINPEFAAAYASRGEAWQAKGQGDKASTDFRKAEQLLKRPLFPIDA